MNNLDIRAWDGEKMSHSKMKVFDDSVNFRFEHFAFEGDNITLMLYTEFKDIENKKIYADDIVRAEIDIYKYENGKEELDCTIIVVGRVIFKDGSFYLQDDVGQEFGFFRFAEGRFKLKVLGNVYKNADLLEVEE